MSTDFCVDHYYGLMASDFLSEQEIIDATSPREFTKEDETFWESFFNGEVF